MVFLLTRMRRSKISQLVCKERTEILKMLYRDNEVLIFDEPTAVLTLQEINELMVIMKNPWQREGKSILFITHKLAEIMAVADVKLRRASKRKIYRNCRYQKYNTEKLSAMMVGRDVNFVVDKKTGENRRCCIKCKEYDRCIKNNTRTMR